MLRFPIIIIIVLVISIVVLLFLINNDISEYFSVKSNPKSIFGIKCLVKDIDPKKKDIPEFKLELIDCNADTCGEITYIMDNTFMLFKKLKKINFIDKNIEALHNKTFFDCEKLEEVNLLKNPLRIIGSDVFRDNLNIIDDSQQKEARFLVSPPKPGDFTDKYRNVISDKITIVLFDDTITHLNEEFNMYKQMTSSAGSTTTSAQYSKLDIGGYSTIDITEGQEVFDFIMKINKLQNEASKDTKKAEQFKNLIFFCLGIDKDVLDKFKIYKDFPEDGKNNVYSDLEISKTFDIVYYKDILYTTDMALWRYHYTKKPESGSSLDPIIDMCCTNKHNNGIGISINSSGEDVNCNNLLDNDPQTTTTAGGDNTQTITTAGKDKYYHFYSLYNIFFSIIMSLDNTYNINNIYLDTFINQKDNFPLFSYPEALKIKVGMKENEKSRINSEREIFKTEMANLSCYLKIIESIKVQLKDKLDKTTDKLQKKRLGIYYNLIKLFDLLDPDIYTKCVSSNSTCFKPISGHISGCGESDSTDNHNNDNDNTKCTKSVIGILGQGGLTNNSNKDPNVIKCFEFCKKFNLNPDWSYSIYVLSEEERFSRLASIIQCLTTTTIPNIHSAEYEYLYKERPNKFLYIPEQHIKLFE